MPKDCHFRSQDTVENYSNKHLIVLAEEQICRSVGKVDKNMSTFDKDAKTCKRRKTAPSKK